jgi:hypothetical protein
VNIEEFEFIMAPVVSTNKSSGHKRSSSSTKKSSSKDQATPKIIMKSRQEGAQEASQVASPVAVQLAVLPLNVNESQQASFRQEPQQASAQPSPHAAGSTASSTPTEFSRPQPKTWTNKPVFYVRTK